jgi:hypothetical protein
MRDVTLQPYYEAVGLEVVESSELAVKQPRAPRDVPTLNVIRVDSRKVSAYSTPHRVTAIACGNSIRNTMYFQRCRFKIV